MMEESKRATHWENIYQKSDDTKVGWYQEVPKHSLAFIEDLDLDKSAPIVDVGAGNSTLVKHLVEKGYTGLTAIDISTEAMEIAKERAGKYASLINWKEGDVLKDDLDGPYHLWHDRAVFHFLWDKAEIKQYVDKACNSLIDNGYLILGTFADDGPDKCSGLPVNKYSEEKMERTFESCFELMKTERVVHHKPDGEPQNYLFGTLRKSR